MTAPRNEAVRQTVGPATRNFPSRMDDAFAEARMGRGHSISIIGTPVGVGLVKELATVETLTDRSRRTTALGIGCVRRASAGNRKHAGKARFRTGRRGIPPGPAGEGACLPAPITSAGRRSPRRPAAFPRLSASSSRRELARARAARPHYPADPFGPSCRLRPAPDRPMWANLSVVKLRGRRNPAPGFSGD